MGYIMWDAAMCYNFPLELTPQVDALELNI